MKEKEEEFHQFHNGWTWKEMSLSDKDKLKQLVSEIPASEIWVNNTLNINTSYLRVITLDTTDKGDALIGSLNYSNEPEDPEQNQFMHYYVTDQVLITVDLDFSVFSKITRHQLMHRLNRCKDGFEGFLVILGELLNTFLDGIDDFEETLIELEREVKFDNQSKLLESIIDQRSSMLFLKHHVIPIEEILLGMQEVFIDIQEQPEFRKTAKRLERTLTLLNHYENQIETLLNMNMNLFSFRGNEIIKMLTIFTVLVTPITVLGALWGMNFKGMPEFDWKFGYAFAWGVIVATTALTYFWLRKKGVIGDILQKKK